MYSQEKKHLLYEHFFLSLSKLIKRKKSKINKNKSMICRSNRNSILYHAKKTCEFEVIKTKLMYNK